MKVSTVLKKTLVAIVCLILFPFLLVDGPRPDDQNFWVKAIATITIFKLALPTSIYYMVFRYVLA